MRVLDWVAFSQGHPGWFQPDGLHLTFPGAHGFTKLLRKGLPLAKAGKFPALRWARSRSSPGTNRRDCERAFRPAIMPRSLAQGGDEKSPHLGRFCRPGAGKGIPVHEVEAQRG
ncbi:MAG: hypothetical protein AABM43_02165 [Actinomycetota bacterium]